uniref:Tyrosine-protein kinase Src42A-like isoform X2 n=1 Tax=Rhizophora mucronata TaxID=61149 RepID=A0A2P2LTA6_RHIMU
MRYLISPHSLSPFWAQKTHTMFLSFQQRNLISHIMKMANRLTTIALNLYQHEMLIKKHPLPLFPFQSGTLISNCLLVMKSF